jgi:RHS repeat-associated protein
MTISRTYIRLGSELIAMRVLGDTSLNSGYFYFKTNNLGSLTGTTKNGVIVGSNVYYPYGSPLSTNSDPNNKSEFRFTGQRMDTKNKIDVSPIGLYFYGSRYFDPYLNRWIQPDNIVPDPYDPGSWDRYNYVRSNPIKFGDPSGHREESRCEALDCNINGGTRLQLVEKYNKLANSVVTKGMDSLQALVALVKYAASFSPSCAECFINNLGSVLTGLSAGNSFVNELKAQMGLYKYDSNYDNKKNLGQNGYAAVFQDPDLSQGGGNQAHHYWFYVQVGFDGGVWGSVTGRFGNILHESFLTNNTRGNSQEDMALGIEGTELGVALRSGAITPSQAGQYISDSLSPNSSAALYWMKFFYHVDDIPFSYQYPY